MVARTQASMQKNLVCHMFLADVSGKAVFDKHLFKLAWDRLCQQMRDKPQKPTYSL